MSTGDLAVGSLPHLDSVVVDHVVEDGPVVRVRARVRGLTAGCPGCGVLSERVHTRYDRHLDDAALGGRPVRITLSVRRFRCAEASCTRKTFAEQVPELAGRYQRRTHLLNGILRQVAIMLCGRPAARLAGRLWMSVSRSSLLRLLRAEPLPAVAPESVKEVGIDDFALRKGHVYGTVVIDMVTHTPIEVLPERSSGVVARWLQEHPQITVICRDRAGSYAEAASTGAPDATQIADRWHLYHNLCQAVEKAVFRLRRDIPEPIIPSCEPPAVVPALPVDPQPAPSNPGRLEVRSRERFQEVQELRAAGRSISAIGRDLGLDRKTVRKFATATDPQDVLSERAMRSGRSPERPSVLDAYRTYLHQRWAAGIRDAALLFQEITSQGYTGSAKTVRRYTRILRSSQTAPPVTPPPPSPRQVTGWITRHPDDVNASDTIILDGILERSPALVTTARHVSEFAKMLTQLEGRNLPAWLKDVDQCGEPEMRSFAKGLRRDLDAVTAGLTMPQSSGPVEGNINRIKTIKRQMYGRAGFDLLRRRILLRD